MSVPVSNLEFWKKPFSDSDTDITGKGAYLSYDLFWGLSILGGFFALDHLYLRSPISFLGKLFINVTCFGIWYIYDMAQALFNKEVIKVYGLGIPGFGPMGIGAGVLGKENDGYDAAHLRFFIYSLCLMLGGAIGLDSFIVGDQRTGVMRLLLFISVIFAPVALAWWAYKLFQFFINTPNVVHQYNEYFGGTSGFFNFGFMGETFKPLFTVVDSFGKIINTVGNFTEVLGKGIGATAAAQVYAAKGDDLKTAIQKGGALTNDLNIQPILLLATIAFIVLVGFISTIYRSKNNGRENDKNDVPPEPGIFRKPHSKKSTNTT